MVRLTSHHLLVFFPPRNSVAQNAKDRLKVLVRRGGGVVVVDQARRVLLRGDEVHDGSGVAHDGMGVVVLASHFLDRHSEGAIKTVSLRPRSAGLSLLLVPGLGGPDQRSSPVDDPELQGGAGRVERSRAGTRRR